MQVGLVSHKNTKASIKNLETRVGQLGKQFLELPSNTFSSNINMEDSHNVALNDDEVVVKTKEKRPEK